MTLYILQVSEEVPRLRAVWFLDGSTPKYRVVPSSNLDFSYHVRQVPGFEKGTSWSSEQVRNFCGSLAGVDFDPSRPFWTFYLVPEVENGSKSCLIAHFNHCVGDGNSLVQLLLRKVADPNPSIVTNSQQKRVQPTKLKISLWTKVKAFFAGTKQALLALFLKGDAPNMLKLKNHKKPSLLEKQLAASEEIDLGKFKEIKDRIPDASVNDVMLAVSSIMLRNIYTKHDPEFLARNNKVRAQFVFDLRKRTDDVLKDSFGNIHALPQLVLPLNTYNAGEELVHEMQQRSLIVKLSPEARLKYQLGCTVTRFCTKPIVYKIMMDLNAKPSFVMSNIRGPQDKLKILKSDIENLSFHALTPVGVYLGLISYNNKVSCSVSVDPQIPISAQDIIKEWPKAFHQLYESVVV